MTGYCKYYIGPCRPSDPKPIPNPNHIPKPIPTLNLTNGDCCVTTSGGLASKWLHCWYRLYPEPLLAASSPRHLCIVPLYCQFIRDRKCHKCKSYSASLTLIVKVKVKVAHTGISAFGPELIPVIGSQPPGDT